MRSVAKTVGTLMIVAAVAMAAVAASFAMRQDQYAVYVDGQVVVATGTYGTVADLLAGAGVELREGDLIDPPLPVAIQPDSAVQVLRAKTVTVVTDDGRQNFTTHQTTIGRFLTEANIEIRRTDQVLADGTILSYGQILETALPFELQIGRFQTITIRDGEQSTSLVTSAQTVGEALTEAGFNLYAADGVSPAMGSWLTPNLEIVIRRSKPLTILVDGRILQTRSHHDRVLDVLGEVGIGLVGYDYTRPASDAILQANDIIEVVRVTEDFELTDTPISFETVWQPTDQLEIDLTGVLVAGQDGIFRERTRIRYENGVEVGREPDGDWVALQPVQEVLGYGTRIEIRTLDTPQGAVEYWRKVRMRVTSYTAATSGKAPDHPAYGITASGVQAGFGVVAIDPTVVPFRSDVYVPGYGVGFAGDTGGGVKGRWIDLGYDDDALQWWSGYVDVYYLTPVPEPERINFLIPNWLP